MGKKILNYIFSEDTFTYFCGIMIIISGALLLKHIHDPSELTTEIYKIKDVLLACLIIVWGYDITQHK